MDMGHYLSIKLYVDTYMQVNGVIACGLDD